MQVIKRVVALVLIALAPAGAFAAAAYEKLSGQLRTDLLEAVLDGRANLACGLTQGYGRPVKASVDPGKITGYHALGDWKTLIVEVASTGYGGDSNWYLLGRATEGLGYFDIAERYYRRSLNSVMGCRCTGRAACNDFGGFPQLPARRLEKLRLLIQAWPTMSTQEKSLNMKMNLRSHVAFYHCRSWALGVSSKDLKDRIANAPVNDEFVGHKLTLGTARELSSDELMEVYKSIRIPDSDVVAGIGFDPQFDECMNQNGLVAVGDRLDPVAWPITEGTLVAEGYFRSTLALVKQVTDTSCEISLRYFNFSNQVITPIVELTLLDAEKNSISAHTLAMPAIYPRKSFLQPIEIATHACNRAEAGFVTAAMDRMSGQVVKELVATEVELCGSNCN